MTFQKTISSLPKEPIYLDISSSSPKKATDALSLPEQNPPDKKKALSTPKEKPHEEELGAPSWHNSVLTNRKPALVLILYTFYYGSKL